MPSNPHCVLTACGDLMFYGPMAEQMQRHGDPLWAFRPLGDALLKGDLLFGNFETPISVKHCNEADAPSQYYSNPGIALALKQYGFDVVNLAQNHIYDFGNEGVEVTLEEMRQARLAHFGIGRTPDEASKPVIVTARTGMRVAFIGFTTAASALDKKHGYVACFPDTARVTDQVRGIKYQADAVVVSCHTGAQYNPYPAPETRKLAAAAISAGASVFLGHHPHVPNGYEQIGKGLAIYSLGDFAAPVHTEETRRTFFARIHLDCGSVTRHEIIPCFISDECQTTLPAAETGLQISAHIEQISQAIANGCSDELHFNTARGRFFSQYVTSWIRELRFGGPRIILRKIRNLRYYHLQLMGQSLIGIVRQKRKK
jgi:poly-gamma-glutamate capsule biosynthesis protein CapA/YwtB (metallophosphatase superfamily)